VVKVGDESLTGESVKIPNSVVSDFKEGFFVALSQKGD